MSLHVRRDSINVARVLNEDDDFLTLEIAKHSNINMTLDPEIPDRFLFLMFVKIEEGNALIWTPWKE